MDPVTGAIAASAVQAAGNFGQTMLGNRLATAQRHDSQDWNAMMFGTRYQMEVKDMQAAGLNPMLAYMHGPGGAPVSSAGGVAEGHAGDSAVEGYNATRLATAQEANVEAQREVNLAQAGNIRADTLGKLLMPELYRTQMRLNESNTGQSAALTDKYRQELPLIGAQTEESKARRSLTAAEEKSLGYRNSLMMSEQVLNHYRGQIAQLERDILGPKGAAAKMATGQGAAIADNIGRFGKAAWSIASPFSGIGGYNP